MSLYGLCGFVRGHPLSMYPPRGREGGSKKPENIHTIVLIGCVKSVQEGGGVKKAGKSMYVLNGCSFMASHMDGLGQPYTDALGRRV